MVKDAENDSTGRGDAYRLNDVQGQCLLELAAATIRNCLGSVSEPCEPCQPEDSLFAGPGAAFVTLKKRGNLRGCIGSLQAVVPLWQSVRDNAVNAALHDYRFSPLTLEEIEKDADFEIEVSVLTPSISLEYADWQDLLNRLRPGVDGVTLQLGARRSTFLPQVWEQLPRPEVFLGHLCRKAGLAENCWKEDHPDIEIYGVQSFHGSLNEL